VLSRQALRRGGVRVIDLTPTSQAPTPPSSADYGANVIKIRRPGNGDPPAAAPLRPATKGSGLFSHQYERKSSRSPEVGSRTPHPARAGRAPT
jgi:crotonobetainyl-CoA:carnitine CoA-transferase CaiB-like acyl-CoA transferase